MTTDEQIKPEPVTDWGVRFRYKSGAIKCVIWFFHPDMRYEAIWYHAGDGTIRNIEHGTFENLAEVLAQMRQ